MFTGIITDKGQVRAITPGGDARFEISTGFDLSSLDLGASICCSGVCLTVVKKGDNWFGADVSAETLSKTTLGDWGEGTPVNLERTLKIGDEMGGHMVFGHVDGVAEVIGVTEDGDSKRLEFEAPDDLKLLIAAKGSVTLDGVSLTVNGVRDRRFDCNVILHTQEQTTLGELHEGDRVNLEIDMLARYVARLQHQEPGKG